MYTSIVIIFLTMFMNSISATKQAVYFSFIVSRGENGYNSSKYIPVINLALELVQSQKLLPGYNLTYDSIGNSKCKRGDSLAAFLKDIRNESVPKIAVVGCGCSTATEPVAEISHYWNITHISFAAGLPSLSDRSKFPYYFRTTASTVVYSPSIISVLNKFNWKRLAVFTQNHNLFLRLVREVEEKIYIVRTGTINIEVENVVFHNDPVATARRIFDERKYHIYILNCYSRNARRIICEASKRGFIYPHYGWIVFGWYPDRWWTEEVAGEHIDDCTDEELETFMGKSRMLMILMTLNNDNVHQITDAGISASDFIDKYYEKLQAEAGNDASYVSATAFDAMWALALMLNYTEEMRLQNVSKYDSQLGKCHNLNGELVPLNEFRYSNALMGCVMKENYYKLNFTGMLGSVRFDENGTIVNTRSILKQYRVDEGKVRHKRVGYLESSNTSFVYEKGEGDKTVYPDGFPPDGVPVVVTEGVHVAVAVVFYFIALIGITLCAIMFIFNFFYRKTKILRLTTPVLSYVIIGGTFLMYLSVFIGVIPTTEEVLIKIECIVNMWLYGIGYLLVYGTVLAKMLRIYQIFHNPSHKKTILKTWHLACIVCGVTGTGVCLFLARTVAQSLTNPHLVTSRENPKETTASGIHEEHKVWQCYDTSSAPFFLDLVTFVYLGLLQLVGIILAFQTRKVKIHILNDSKSVAALIYISSIVLVVIVLVTFILDEYINASAVLFYGGIITLATVFLALIFVPKIKYIV